MIDSSQISLRDSQPYNNGDSHEVSHVTGNKTDSTIKVDRVRIYSEDNVPVVKESWVKKIINNFNSAVSSIGHKLSISRILSEKNERRQSERVDFAWTLLQKFGEVTEREQLSNLNLHGHTAKAIDKDEGEFIQDINNKLHDGLTLSSSDGDRLKKLDKKYFSADNLFEKRMASKQILDGMWPTDVEFGNFKYNMVDSIEGREKISELNTFFKREKKWKYINKVVAALSQKSSTYSFTSKFFGLFKTFNKDESANPKTLYTLLKDKGILTAQDLLCLNKFVENTQYMNMDEREQLMDLCNDVLSPLFLILNKKSYQSLLDIANSSETSILNKMHHKIHNHVEQISSKDISKLKDLCIKYFGKDNLYQSKKDTQDIYKKFYPDYRNNDKSNRLFESKSVQKEYQLRNEVYERSTNEWKELNTIIKSFESQNIKVSDADKNELFKGNFLALLFKNEVISQKEFELLMAFENPDTAKKLNSNKRKKLNKILQNKLMPIYIAIQNNSETHSQKELSRAIKTVTKRWFSKNDLSKLQQLFAKNNSAPKPIPAAPNVEDHDKEKESNDQSTPPPPPIILTPKRPEHANIPAPLSSVNDGKKVDVPKFDVSNIPPPISTPPSEPNKKAPPPPPPPPTFQQVPPPVSTPPSEPNKKATPPPPLPSNNSGNKSTHALPNTLMNDIHSFKKSKLKKNNNSNVPPPPLQTKLVPPASPEKTTNSSRSTDLSSQIKGFKFDKDKKKTVVQNPLPVQEENDLESVLKRALLARAPLVQMYNDSRDNAEEDPWDDYDDF